MTVLDLTQDAHDIHRLDVLDTAAAAVVLAWGVVWIGRARRSLRR